MGGAGQGHDAFGLALQFKAKVKTRCGAPGVSQDGCAFWKVGLLAIVFAQGNPITPEQADDLLPAILIKKGFNTSQLGSDYGREIYYSFSYLFLVS